MKTSFNTPNKKFRIRSWLFGLTLVVTFLVIALGTSTYAIGCIGCSSSSSGQWYPDRGRLVYTGRSNSVYIDAKWSNPGNWYKRPRGLYTRVGIEFGFATYRKSYFNGLPFKGCSSQTTLPLGYDDCPTAGVSENWGTKVFGYGTWDAKQIIKNKWYYSSIDLQRSNHYYKYDYYRRLPLDYNLYAKELDVTGNWDIWQNVYNKKATKVLIRQSSPDIFVWKPLTKGF